MNRTHPSNANRQRKAWAMSRTLAALPIDLSDTRLVFVDRDVRQLVARAAGIGSRREISDHTWSLAIVHARQLRGK